MYNLLQGLRVVEGASFIAAPSCGLYMAQLGAEVIRFDQIGGGPDFRRWPVTDKGSSLYWEALNKGKKSIAIDLTKPEGRELALRIATSPGSNAGIFLTNFPATGFLSHENLVKQRKDQITIRITGWPDGKSAVDYTINCEVGVPYMTGFSDDMRPTNNVVPAWDLLTGSMAAFSLLAAERTRRTHGTGNEITLSLSDIAISTLANLGQIGEILLHGQDRPRTDNDLFGAFGRDFMTRDQKRIMLVAITRPQWGGLVAALDISRQVEELENSLSISFAHDEGIRFIHRARLNALVEAAINRFDFEDLCRNFDAHRVCFGTYRSLHEAVSENHKLVRQNPVFQTLTNPSGFDYPVPGFAADLKNTNRTVPRRAPFLGEHTEAILTETLSCSHSEIANLHDKGIVSS